MKKRPQDPFRNSELDRAKPRRHLFHAFINDKLKRHRSETGLVEDRTSSTTIIRIIVGLLLVHLIIIGGVLLRGHMVKDGSGLAVTPAITPPPAPTAAPVEEVLPQPVDVAPTVAASRPAANHITQLPADDVAEDVAPEAPVLVTPPPAAPASAVVTPAPAPTVTVRHLIASGDTWTRIASQYGCSIADLKAANPATAAKGVLYSGAYLNVPVGADSSAAREAVAAQPAASTAKTYTIKKGDTLGAIARRNHTTVAKLLKLNNMTEKDARRIKPGMELRISE